MLCPVLYVLYSFFLLSCIGQSIGGQSVDGQDVGLAYVLGLRVYIQYLYSICIQNVLFVGLVAYSDFTKMEELVLIF